MDADEVDQILADRQKIHEEKCDARQATLHTQITGDLGVHLERVVYLGVGIMVTLNVIFESIGPGILQGFFSK